VPVILAACFFVLDEALGPLNGMIILAATDVANAGVEGEGVTELFVVWKWSGFIVLSDPLKVVTMNKGNVVLARGCTMTKEVRLIVPTGTSVLNELHVIVFLVI
jgi:hypothetical protein